MPAPENEYTPDEVMKAARESQDEFILMLIKGGFEVLGVSEGGISSAQGTRQMQELDRSLNVSVAASVATSDTIQ